jgi:hypothetical protein
MLRAINYKLNESIRSITKIHNFIHNNCDISKASLRDVARFKQLYLWFFETIKNKKNERSKFYSNDQIDDELRAVILSFCFVYGLKF